MFGEAFHEVETYSDAQPGAGYLSTLGRDTFIALAAVEGSQVVYGVAAYVTEIRAGAKEIYLRLGSRDARGKVSPRRSQSFRESGAYAVPM
jgi:hypothetical protein